MKLTAPQPLPSTTTRVLREMGAPALPLARPFLVAGAVIVFAAGAYSGQGGSREEGWMVTIKAP